MEIIRLESCDSTNSYLKDNYKDIKERLPLLVTSGRQTGGRGREQRTWVSPEGKGLYSSLAFSLPLDSKLYLLPLIAAVSIIEMLEDIASIPLALKWPNDVLYEGKKLAGILIENNITDKEIFSIVGMGINLNHCRDDFPPELRETATSLKMAAGLPQDLNPGDINPLLWETFFKWLENVTNCREDDVIGKANFYSRHLLGQPISFHQSRGKKIAGTFRGIYHDGGLVLENGGGGTTIYHTGEIV
jgi:BirA family biotin operon repressor/biotin-[acetyl-CoA-carboxylase] ligase